MEISTFDIIGIVLTVVAAVLYGVVAVFLNQRKVSDEARGAQRGFVLWWGGLSALGVYGLIFNETYGISLAEVGLNTTLVVVYVLIVAIYAMLGGLMYYMLYLYTGAKRWRNPIIIFYVFMTVFLVWFIQGAGPCISPQDAGCIPPTGTEEGTTTLGSMEPRADWIGAVFGLLLVVPPLASAIMYFLLFFKVTDATSRFRVACVSGGIILWFGFSAANTLAGIGSDAGASAGSAMVSQVLGVVAASLVLMAYFPPKLFQRRWGLQSLADEN